LHHIPDELKLKYLDSCVLYAQKGVESWRRSEILVSKLIVDNSINKKVPVNSFYNNCDSVVDDLEILELYSVIRYAIKHNKTLKFVVEYTPEYKDIGTIMYNKAIELFPDQRSQIFLRENIDALSLSKNDADKTCIAFKIEK
jgi:hypothetical protein